MASRGNARILNIVSIFDAQRNLNFDCAVARLCAYGHRTSATTGNIQPWVYQQLAQTFILDPAMRERMASLNPAASAKFANRLLEASRRQFWQPDAQTLEALQRAGAELEDRLEGIQEGLPA